MHFGENELSPCLIGLSPLPTVHPKTFQRLTVRSSNKSYPVFNLTMGSSHGFASKTTDYIALFRLAFATTTGFSPLISPVTLTRRFIMQKARRRTYMLRPLVNTRFQVLFHPPTRSTFHLSLTVLVHYRSLKSI